MGITGSQLTVIGSKSSAQIEELVNSESGAIYFASNSADIYVGNGLKAKKFSGIITAKRRPSEPILSQAYWIGVAGEYSLEAYIGGKWETISGTNSYNNGDYETLLSTENTWLKKQTFNEGVNLGDWNFSVGDNGHLILTGLTDKDLHVSGNVHAFSDSIPPASSWWSDMPIATDSVLGGIKEGSGLTIAADGTASVTGGGTAAIWGQITGDILNQGDLASTYASKSWIGTQGFLTSESDTLASITARGSITSDNVAFNGTVNIQSWKIEEDSNGHLILTGATDKDLHVSGNVHAFSDSAPPVSSWWDDMPIATTSILGGVIVGANLTVDANGVLNGQAGGIGGANWGEIGGSLGDQADIVAEFLTKGNISGGNTWSGTQYFNSEVVVNNVGNSTQWQSAYTHSTQTTGAPHGMWNKTGSDLSYSYGNVEVTNGKHINVFNNDNSKQWAISVDSNGNIILTGGLNQDLHVSGNVHAFSDSAPPVSSWWDDMPIASESILGGFKVGDNLTIDIDGVLNATGGGDPYVLPQADGTTLGGVKIGGGVNTYQGFLNIEKATASQLGGVKVGVNLTVEADGTLNADTSSSDTFQDVLTRGTSFTSTLNYTPTTGIIINGTNGAILRKLTTGGGLSLGTNDGLLLGSGEAIGSMITNINAVTEQVHIGSENGVKFYAFPNNDVTWSNRKEMVYGVNGTLSVPSTVTAPTFVGNLTGNASSSTSSSYMLNYLNRTDGTSYPVVWNNNTTSSPNYSCAAVRIQSSTGTLIANVFSGALSGNASTATQATKVTVTNHTTNNIEYPLVWHNDLNTLFDSNDRLTFNPSLGRITSRQQILSRASASEEAAIRYNTSGYGYDWLVGLDNNSLNFDFYSYGIGSQLMSLGRDTGNVGIGIKGDDATDKLHIVSSALAFRIASSVIGNNSGLVMGTNTSGSYYVGYDINGESTAIIRNYAETVQAYFSKGGVSIGATTSISGERLSIARTSDNPSIKANTDGGDGYMVIDSGGTGDALLFNHYVSDHIGIGNGGGDVYIYNDLYLGKAIRRNYHSSGYLEGSYNNVGSNDAKTNPIYTIGSSYAPTDTLLSNMYGIGYSHTNAPFLTGKFSAGWGMYVAASGVARIFLNSDSGNIECTGDVVAYA